MHSSYSPGGGVHRAPPTVSPYWPQEQKRRILGAYEAPSVPKTDLAVILVIGTILSFVLTMVFYAWYAATEYDRYSPKRFPLPVITDMLTDWPVAASVSMGAGTTLVCTAIVAVVIARIPWDIPFGPRTTLVRTAVITQSSAWILICSSNTGSLPKEMVGWVHNASVVIFVAAAAYTMETVHYICRFLCDAMLVAAADPSSVHASHPHPSSRSLGKLSSAAAAGAQGTLMTASDAIFAARFFLWVVWISLGVAAAAVIGANVWEVLNEYRSSHLHAQYFWQMLVGAELALISSLGIGCILLIYTYMKLEDAAQEFIAVLSVG